MEGKAGRKRQVTRGVRRRRARGREGETKGKREEHGSEEHESNLDPSCPGPCFGRRYKSIHVLGGTRDAANLGTAYLYEYTAATKRENKCRSRTVLVHRQGIDAGDATKTLQNLQ